MFDLKTDAPSEIRGEFSPIGTNVPGIRICEHLPRLADRRSPPSTASAATPIPAGR